MCKERPTYGFCYASKKKAKVKYLTRKHAEDFILANNFTLRAYHCTECDYFHLTGRMTTSQMRLVAPAVKKRKRKPRRLV